MNEEKGTGVRVIELYRSLGMRALPVYAQYAATNRKVRGSSGLAERMSIVSVERGLIDIAGPGSRPKSSRSSRAARCGSRKCAPITAKTMKIVKIDDDLMDATRYAIMMLRFAHADGPGGGAGRDGNRLAAGKSRLCTARTISSYRGGDRSPQFFPPIAVDLDPQRDGSLSREQLQMFLWEMNLEPEWRAEAEVSMAFYDGRPAPVRNAAQNEGVRVCADHGEYDRAGPSDAVSGWETIARADLMCVPETEESYQAAMGLNVKFKEALRLTNFNQVIGYQFKEAIKIGVSWIEVTRNPDPFQYPYQVSLVPWREMFCDYRAREADYSDARYMLRRKWYDFDELMHHFPKHRREVEQAIGAVPDDWTLGWGRAGPQRPRRRPSAQPRARGPVDARGRRNGASGPAAAPRCTRFCTGSRGPSNACGCATAASLKSTRPATFISGRSRPARRNMRRGSRRTGGRLGISGRTGWATGRCA